MKTKLCFGNWKLNFGPLEALNFLKEWKKFSDVDSCEAAFFPSALTASVFFKSNLMWGGQNIFSQASGAFTGENSAQVLKEVGASYVLIGHSERRTLFGESSKSCNEKTKLSLSTGLTPVYCIGETQTQREQNKTFQVLKDQIDEGLDGVEASKVIVAYEPVWAIGTGLSATPSQVDEVHNELRGWLPQTSFLYGGSVKPGNAKELYDLKNVNGFLVGGASLKPESFYKIYKNMGNKF